MKITKLGHCCLLIETKGIRFLTDPGNYTTAQNEIKNIDYVVITHEHTDHLHIESLQIVLKNNPQARVISNGSVEKILLEKGISITKVSHGEKIELGGVLLEAFGAKHHLIYKDYEQVENTGYFFDNKLFYPGDAFNNPGKPVEILAFPISAPWSNVSEAVSYVIEVKPKIAIPVHDGNLIRHGITTRLPTIFLPKEGIEYVALEIGKEREF